MPSIRPRGRAWQQLRLLILDRDRWLCQMRGPRCTRFATTVDHIIPIADGGDMYDPTNLRAACHRCNSAGGADRTNRTRRQRTTVADYHTRF